MVEKADCGVGQTELSLLGLVESQIDSIGLPFKLSQDGRCVLIPSGSCSECVERQTRGFVDFGGVGGDALTQFLRIQRLAVLADLLEQRRTLRIELDEGLLPRLLKRPEALGVGEEPAVTWQARARQRKANRIADGQAPSGHGLDDLGTELAELHQ